MMTLSTWLSRTTNPRLAAQHSPGLLPGAKAATASKRTSSVTGVARAEKLSMMGVSQSARMCWTTSQYAARSSFMSSPSSTSSSSARNTAPHTTTSTSRRLFRTRPHNRAGSAEWPARASLSSISHLHSHDARQYAAARINDVRTSMQQPASPGH